MNICVIGAGPVGLVTSACLASIGHKIICTDDDREKINLLMSGKVPFYEPGLQELVTKEMGEKKLDFTDSLEVAIKNSLVVFVAVGTPTQPEGDADLSFVENVCCGIAGAMKEYKVIVEKSTVPVKTGERISHTLETNNVNRVDFDVASNPEFLREGNAISDFMHPDRIVLGVASKRAEDILKEVYAPINAPILVTDIKSAELIKHASNSFLALKISYINAVSVICELVGADVEKVAEGLGLDKRIVKDFLNPGVGYGGSCFPKDISAFIRMADDAGYDFELLKTASAINQRQRAFFIKKIKDALWTLKGKTVGVLGLSFKPNTDDIREAPSIYIIRELQSEGVKIRSYDPAAMENAGKVLEDVTFCNDPYELSSGCDALAIVTEWEEFRKLDLQRLKALMKAPVIIDGRNIFEPSELKKAGFRYSSIGR